MSESKTYPDPCVCGGTRENPNPDCERCDFQIELTRLQAALAEAERERDEELQARTNAEFELLALRDEVARLKRPVTGEEIRVDAEEANLRSELSADDGEELAVPLRVYNQLSADSLALDAEWRGKLTAATARAEGMERGINDFIQWTIDTDHDYFDEQIVRETLRAILSGTLKRA